MILSMNKKLILLSIVLLIIFSATLGLMALSRNNSTNQTDTSSRVEILENNEVISETTQNLQGNIKEIKDNKITIRHNKSEYTLEISPNMVSFKIYDTGVLPYEEEINQQSEETTVSDTDMEVEQVRAGDLVYAVAKYDNEKNAFLIEQIAIVNR